MQTPSFTIRVYGIWINEQHQILLSDERIGEFEFTKFPGGGLEYGEGTLECVKREWQEELGVEIKVLEHFYTTDYFQASAFHSQTQVLSIYYLVKPIDLPNITYQDQSFSFTYQGKEEVLFRWVDLSLLSSDSVTLPIDKKVAELLTMRFRN